MNLKSWLAATAMAVATVAGASAASASIVYNNGAPDALSGNETAEWVQTEDFSFGANTALTGAGVYIGTGSWDGSFQYYLFSDNAGNPGSVLASDLVSPTVTDAGISWPFGSGDVNLYAFDFASTFNALAGVTYHLGIHAEAPGSFNRDEVYWVSTAGNSTNTGIESNGGTFDNWSNNGQEHAFFLTGGGGVPEPATWGLMIAGFGLAGASLRARRKVIA